MDFIFYKTCQSKVYILKIVFNYSKNKNQTLTKTSQNINLISNSFGVVSSYFNFILHLNSLVDNFIILYIIKKLNLPSILI